MENWIVIGLTLIFIGFFIIFFSSMKNAEVKSAGGIFIGPFPIFGWFTDKKMFYLLLIFALIIFMLFILFKKWI